MRSGTLPDNTRDRVNVPRNVIVVDDKFRLTPLRASMIAFYLKTMLGPEKIYANTTEYIQGFAEMFNVTERGCWYAWKIIKPVITQIKTSRSSKLYFAFSMNGFDYMVKKFLDGKKYFDLD